MAKLESYFGGLQSVEDEHGIMQFGKKGTFINEVGEECMLKWTQDNSPEKMENSLKDWNGTFPSMIPYTEIIPLDDCVAVLQPLIEGDTFQDLSNHLIEKTLVENPNDIDQLLEICEVFLLHMNQFRWYPDMSGNKPRNHQLPYSGNLFRGKFRDEALCRVINCDIGSSCHETTAHKWGRVNRDITQSNPTNKFWRSSDTMIYTLQVQILKAYLLRLKNTVIIPAVSATKDILTPTYQTAVDAVLADPVGNVREVMPEIQYADEISRVINTLTSQ